MLKKKKIHDVNLKCFSGVGVKYRLHVLTSLVYSDKTFGYLAKVVSLQKIEIQLNFYNLSKLYCNSACFVVKHSRSVIRYQYTVHSVKSQCIEFS